MLTSASFSAGSRGEESESLRRGWPLIPVYIYNGAFSSPALTSVGSDGITGLIMVSDAVQRCRGDRLSTGHYATAAHVTAGLLLAA